MLIHLWLFITRNRIIFWICAFLLPFCKWIYLQDVKSSRVYLEISTELLHCSRIFHHRLSPLSAYHDPLGIYNIKKFTYFFQNQNSLYHICSPLWRICRFDSFRLRVSINVCGFFWWLFGRLLYLFSLNCSEIPNKQFFNFLIIVCVEIRWFSDTIEILNLMTSKYPYLIDA